MYGIALATFSCLFLHSFCASFEHALSISVIVIIIIIIIIIITRMLRLSLQTDRIYHRALI